MFYHSNGKLTVLSQTRCGHTNMYYYFGITVYSLMYAQMQPTNDLVVVIRNPIDRMMSAIEGMSPWLHMFTPDPVWFKLDPVPTKNEIRERVIFELHCKPYLHTIVDQNFRIIDFNKLEQYISRPKSDKIVNLFQSPTTFTKGLTNPKEHYVENSVFSLEDLESEYELYLQIMQTKEQISVEEWKNLTQGDPQ